MLPRLPDPFGPATRGTGRSGDKADNHAPSPKILLMPRYGKMTHVLIATPTAGGVVKTLFVTTLVKVALALRDAGWDADYATVDGSYVSVARNYFANVLLRNPQFTHLVMIDSDMCFEGHVISRLLRSGKPVVAAAYSQRRMNMESFAGAARNPELALPDLAALSLQYNIQPDLEPGTRQVRVVDGMCRVTTVALGCSVIRRDAFEDLIASGMARVQPGDWSRIFSLEDPFYDFFGEITLENGTRLSEDYSFCKRWLSTRGNEIWAVVDEPIGHVGDMVFNAPYLNRLLRGAI